MAGGLLTELVRRHRGAILPIDSEHCAIHQCLQGDQRRFVRRIWLTGSGGPFRQRPLHTFDSITPSQALQHPTWTMGPRITIGSTGRHTSSTGRRSGSASTRARTIAV